ncbi:MAG: VWA domain-containing protein [Butyricicoccus pullicaecorum]|nr:VWA domain-containing protein [Butyricicoccus pullicaecorum]MDO4669061.1 VWA domain-containing protein [Butyricicoccus pullicaecorum]
MQNEQMARWRLILGEQTQDTFSGMGMDALSKEQMLMDEALAEIYGVSEGGGSGRGAGRGPSAPHISKWLGDIRSLFEPDMVAVVQSDAVERRGLKQLLLEPELLDNLEPDLNMASTLLMLKDQIPKKSKESARRFIQKIVESINRKMETQMRRAVTAALNKKEHSPLPSASAIDFRYTIARNLRNYDPTLGVVIPERVYFFDRASKVNRWHVILDIDQSGSMGESIIYSSIMACILASMASVKTNVVAFDTQIMDLTDLCEDPVDLLFGFQMGGGTDIAKSLHYCRRFVESPDKTLFFLISDLDEGGNRAGLLNHLREMKESGVTVVVLLAVADGGRPYYDEKTAKRIAEMDIPCFACTPEKLPELIERTFKKYDLTEFAKQMKKK